MENSIKIIPLGGCGEIGMNMTLLAINERYFFIDCGALFPDPTNVGVDLILPNTLYIDENHIHPEAWFITHGHEDHIGALPFLFKKYPAPIYGTEFTLELIKAKFLDANISQAVFHVWQPDQPVLFRNMKVTPFCVNHSIADAAGLFFETQFGNILHMGDFRIDYCPPEKTTTHENLQKVLLGKSVTLMLSDSTNAFSEGADKSESDITPAFIEYLKSQQGAVIVSTFASNIWRLQSVFTAAQTANRRVAIFGRTMIRNIEIAQRLNLLHFNENILVPISELSHLARNEIVILCTGSQGESFSGLHRLAWGNLSEFQISSHDLVLFSSRIIPGNEKPIESLVTQLTRLGCQVVTTRENPSIHVSGHGYAQDLKKCIQLVKPQAFMPVHGTYRHLKKHRELAIESGVSSENCYLVENGDVVLACPQPHGVIDKVPSGRDYVCPGGIYEQNSPLYRDRIHLARSGVVAISLPIKANSYQLASVPVISMRGLHIDETQLLKKIPQLYEQILEIVTKRKRFDESILQEEFRIAIRKYLENIYGFKTVVLFMLVKI